MENCQKNNAQILLPILKIFHLIFFKNRSFQQNKEYFLSKTAFAENT